MTSLVHPRSRDGLAQAGTAPAAPGSLSELLLRPLRAMRTWWQRHEAREQLLRLDAHMLRDIGLTRADVLREWQKGFWEA
jgi:uncharacterized protein YjiS (DUF1127 family)